MKKSTRETICASIWTGAVNLRKYTLGTYWYHVHALFQIPTKARPVIAAKHDDSTPGNAKGEEHLACCLSPNLDENCFWPRMKKYFSHLKISKLFPSASVGHKEIMNASPSPRQGDRHDQQDEKDQVGEGGGEVDHLGKER